MNEVEARMQDWKLRDPEDGDRIIYAGARNRVCARLLSDTTATEGSRGERLYAVDRPDDATALVVKLGREFKVCSVVGPREDLRGFMKEVDKTLRKLGGVAA